MILEKVPTPHMFPYHPAEGKGIPVRREDERRCTGWLTGSISGKQRFREGWSIRKDFPAVGNVPQDGPQVVRRVSEPHLYPQEAPPRPVTGPYLEVIRAWLVEDLQAPRKQRHTARRVYDRLVAERGFKGSESIIRKVVAEIKKRSPRRRVFFPWRPPRGNRLRWIGGRRWYASGERNDGCICSA